MAVPSLRQMVGTDNYITSKFMVDEKSTSGFETVASFQDLLHLEK